MNQFKVRYMIKHLDNIKGSSNITGPNQFVSFSLNLSDQYYLQQNELPISGRRISSTTTWIWRIPSSTTIPNCKLSKIVISLTHWSNKRDRNVICGKTQTFKLKLRRCLILNLEKKVLRFLTWSYLVVSRLNNTEWVPIYRDHICDRAFTIVLFKMFLSFITENTF